IGDEGPAQSGGHVAVVPCVRVEACRRDLRAAGLHLAGRLQLPILVEQKFVLSKSLSGYSAGEERDYNYRDKTTNTARVALHKEPPHELWYGPVCLGILNRFKAKL